MFQYFLQKNANDRDYSARTQLLSTYTRVLEGSLYDCLPYYYWNEYDMQGAYIPLTARRPSVTSGIRLCRLVVDESVALTFGSDHFPRLNCKNPKKLQFTETVIKACKLQLKMIEAATVGSIGSVAMIARILNGNLFYDIKNTTYLTPFYDPNDPSRLIKIIETYKVDGKDLAQQGFNIKDVKKRHWYLREWNENQEIIYNPIPVTEKNPTRSVFKETTHNYGFVPAVWSKNLPRAGAIDGYCTFEAATDTCIEIDYQLSQAGRALKYSADPSVVLQLEDPLQFNDANAQTVSTAPIALPGGGVGTMQVEGASGLFGYGDANQQRRVIRSASNSLVVGKDENVKMLEISGEASRAVQEYVRFLRELALESIHGNRANADRINAAQSGKAMQAMNQSLIWLADRLRMSYGSGGLLPLLELTCKMTQTSEVIINGERYKNIDCADELSLIWPEWYPSSADEKVQMANALKIHADSGHISQDTAIKAIAADFDIQDIEQEKAQIAQDKAAINALNPKLVETQSI